MLLASIFSFPTMFSTLPKTNFNLLVTFILSSANAFNLDRCNILSYGNQHFLLFQKCFLYPSLNKFRRCKILSFGKELMTLKKKALEKIVGKGENAAFPLFPLMFPTLSNCSIFSFSHNFSNLPNTNFNF